MMVEREQRVCKVHGLTNFNKQKNGNAAPRFRCAKCAADAVAELVEVKRQKAYEKYGCSCKICGYNRCRNALEWHHIDPTKKEVEPSKVFSRSWENVVKELDKCVLLCSNCHREVHSGVTSFPL